jgi:hypothetical protein
MIAARWRLKAFLILILVARVMGPYGYLQRQPWVSAGISVDLCVASCWICQPEWLRDSSGISPHTEDEERRPC